MCSGLAIAVVLAQGVATADVARIDARVQAYADGGLFSGIVLVYSMICRNGPSEFTAPRLR